MKLLNPVVWTKGLCLFSLLCVLGALGKALAFDDSVESLPLNISLLK
jgi:hypothetical protein